MLGSSEVKSIYNSYNSVYAQPKVVAEWNANMFAQPYIAAGGNFGAITDSPTYKTASNTTISGGNGNIAFTSLDLASTNAIRVSFNAKSTSPIECTVTLTGKTASSVIVDSKSKKINLGYTFERYHVDFYSYDISKTSLVKIIDMNFRYLESSQNIIVQDIEMFKISRYDAKNNNEIPVESIFSKRFGGEVFVDNPSIAASELPNNTNIVPHNIMFNKMISEKNSSGLDVCRNYIPSKYSKYKYFIMDTSVDSDIFIKYKTSFKMNKLVIKSNSAHDIPDSISFSLLNSGGTWESQTISGSSTFENNGLLVLYWNGTNWSKTKWTTTPYLSEGVLSVSPKIVSGIKVSFDTFKTPEGTSDNEFHLVEVSPRFEVDLTKYVQTVDISKELSNDKLPVPIGVSTSNASSVTFSNTPDEIGGVNVFPFSNDSSIDSPLRGIIDKNVKFKISFITYDNNDVEYETPAATMYTASWTSDFQMTSKAECFDIAKNLSTIQAPIIYEKGIYPEGVAARLLDSVGFTDYDYTALTSNNSEIISHYWTVRDKSVLDSIQEVLLAYQTSMYIDEYGIIRFQKLSDIISKANSTPDFISTDSDYESYKSNIISYNEQVENRPAEIAVGYTLVNPKDTVVYPNGSTSAQYSKVWTAPAEMLGLIKLSKNLSATDDKLNYKFDSQFSTIQSFSGYLLIDDEIVSFDGQRWKIGNSQCSYVVKNAEELEYYKQLELAKQEFKGAVSAYPLYELCNLKRGLFGTAPADHTISQDLSTRFSTYADILAGGSMSRNSISNALIKDDFGMKILPLGSDTAVKRKIAFLNETTNSNHKIYSATFSLEKDATSKLPPKDESTNFGMIIGAQTGSVGGRIVELSIKRHKVQQTVVIRSVVRTYRLGSDGSKVDEKTYTLYNAREKILLKSLSRKLIQKGRPEDVLNLRGQNTLTAILSDNGKKLAVLVNGNVITWEGEKESEYIKVSTSDGSSSFTIPSINLGTAVTTNGRYFGAYASSKVKVTVNALEAFELKYDGSLNTAETIATVVWGNQYNLTNKNELESVFTESSEKDKNLSITFKPTSVAREIKIFDVDYQVMPVTSSQLIKNISVINNRNGTSLIIPGDAISVSSFLNDVVGAKFALMNAYSEPVYLNASTSNQSSTYIVGTPLEPKAQKYVRLYGNINDESRVNLQSDWIQNENSARRILSSINSLIMMKKSVFDVEIFGNPLIQTGDVVGFRYEQKSIDLKNYLVVAVKIGYNNGITTSLKLRRIQE